MKTKKKKTAPPEDEPSVELVDSEQDSPQDCEVAERLNGVVPPLDQSMAAQNNTFVENTQAVVEAPTTKPEVREFPSLYDTIPTTFGAVLLGGLIVGGVQVVVRKIFEREKKEHKALTQFVTSMFALIVGIWIADKLVAGPSADLLWEQESRDVLVFIKDITLMVFAYYFGVKAQPPKEDD